MQIIAPVWSAPGLDTEGGYSRGLLLYQTLMADGLMRPWAQLPWEAAF